PQEFAVELTALHVEPLAGQHQATKAVFAVSLRVHKCPDATEHRLVTKEDNVRRIALAAGVNIHCRLEPASCLGKQVDDSVWRLFVLEEIRAVQALLQRVDDRHGRPSLKSRR